MHHVPSRDELLSLQKKRRYPSISLLAPTHRTAPANRKDRIVVKNLLAKAVNRLHEEFPKREVAAVVQKLQKLVAGIDYEHSLDGLALFASRDFAAAFRLPFRVKARAAIDATFATRDLVFTLNRAPRYRVLVLSEKPTRLYDASSDLLSEHKVKPFPLVHRGPGGAAKLPGGQGINRSAVRDRAHRQFFRKVDDALAVVQKNDHLPMVVVGVERNLAFFQEGTKDPDAVVGLVAGNHDRTNPAALAKLVWPVFKSGLTLKRTQALVRLQAAVSAGRHASGIDQVWRAAFESRCQTLLVEADFHYPANLSPQGDRLLKYTGQGASALDDAVDEAIEKVLAKGGEVYFYEPKVLDLHQRIAAILRY